MFVRYFFYVVLVLGIFFLPFLEPKAEKKSLYKQQNIEKPLVMVSLSQPIKKQKTKKVKKLSKKKNIVKKNIMKKKVFIKKKKLHKKKAPLIKQEKKFEKVQPVKKELVKKIEKKVIKKKVKDIPKKDLKLNKDLTTSQLLSKGSQQNLKQVKTQYFHNVFKKIETYKKFPRKAKRFKREGDVKIGFDILADGSFTNLHIIKKAKYHIFNKSVLNIFKNIDTFLVPPSQLASPLHIELTISYKLH